MDTLVIEGGDKTPTLNFNSDGNFFIGGRSIPENTVEFYKPLFEWLESYAKSPGSTTTLTVQLEYFNTSSSKCLLDLFRHLEKIKSSGAASVLVIWKYEEDDEDIMEAGEDYESIVDVDFELKQITD